MADDWDTNTHEKPLLNRLPPIIQPVAIGLFCIFILPILVLIKLIIMPFERPVQLSAEEVATYIRDFIDGKGAGYDWDDFISIPIKDPRLEDIRQRASEVDLTVTPEGFEALRKLAEEAECLIIESPKSASS